MIKCSTSLPSSDLANLASEIRRVEPFSERRPRHVLALKVKGHDTSGCGDVFHGAYAAALAKGMAVDERLRFASAAEALKATRHGGPAGIPTARGMGGILRRGF